MSKIDNITKRWADIMSCIGCGDCGYAIKPAVGRYLACPVKEALGGESFEPNFARGRMGILKSILEGKITLGKDLVDSVYQCTECGSCTEICHQTQNPKIVLNTSKWIDHVEVWNALRQDLVENGLAPLDKHAKLLGNMNDSSMRNPYGEPKASKQAWARGLAGISKSADVALFAGCTYPLRIKETLVNLARIFKAARTSFKLLDDEWCCGSIALRVGDRKAAKATIIHDIEQIKASGVKTVFAVCAGCYRTMKKDWPVVLGADLPFQVLHVTEVLSGMLDKGSLKLKPSQDPARRVAYHDPCHLGRHMKLYDIPRGVIMRVPGTDYVELKRNKQNAWCCGAGGGVKSQYPDLAATIGKERLRDAIDAKAEFLLSACPFCVANLQEAAVAEKSSIRVMDIIDYFAMML
nr:(Fe-S)-binding protein [Candidatus Sigynarchaeota archaeon]